MYFVFDAHAPLVIALNLIPAQFVNVIIILLNVDYIVVVLNFTMMTFCLG